MRVACLPREIERARARERERERALPSHGSYSHGKHLPVVLRALITDYVHARDAIFCAAELYPGAGGG